MNFKNIDWDHVTRYSQIVAIVVFVGVFALGFWLGRIYEHRAFTNAISSGLSSLGGNSYTDKPIADVTYECDGGSSVEAIYRDQRVSLLLSDGRKFAFKQTISGSGARYANDDESIVFWNKGNTAFVTEGKDNAAKTTFANCVGRPQPQ